MRWLAFSSTDPESETAFATHCSDQCANHLFVKQNIYTSWAIPHTGHNSELIPGKEYPSGVSCNAWNITGYRKVSNIRRTKSQNLNASRLILELSLPIPLKPGVKLRMKM